MMGRRWEGGKVGRWKGGKVQKGKTLVFPLSRALGVAPDSLSLGATASLTYTGIYSNGLVI